MAIILNQNLLTYNSKLYKVEQDYYSPSVSILNSNGQNLFTIYAFLSKVLPYNDPNNPPVPTQDQQNIKSIYNNMIVAKRILSNGMSPVIPRINWTTGTVYNYYQDNVDMFVVDANGILSQPFYVKNKYEQIFKCLWNNNGAASTVEPNFQPGYFNQNNIFQVPVSAGGDGYKWKYMFTIDTGSKLTFMDSNWIPILAKNIQNSPNPSLTSSGSGEITVVNVTNGGSGYTNNSIITININGDGTGATANPVLDTVNGVITDIIVTNPGSNYSYANVSISSTIGSGATAIAPASPIGGHNYNPIAELGCNHIMYTAEFNGSENGYLPTNIQFFQMGLLVNPSKLIAANTVTLANDSIYNCSTLITVTAGQGKYQLNDFVYQGSYSNPFFSGTVLNFDSANNNLYLINTVGTVSVNNTLFGLSGAVRTIKTITPSNFVKYSGYLIYVENRSGVQRSPTGIEQIKFVIGY